jgi:hypothetical protein
MIQRPDAPSFERGRPFAEEVTAEKLNALTDLVNECKRQLNLLEGKIPEVPGRQALTVPVVQGAEIAGQSGRYAGRILQPPVIHEADLAGLQASELGFDPGADDAEIWDVSQASTGDGTTVRLGRLAAYRGDGKKIVLVDGAGAGGFWAELTGTYNASTAYPWKRLVADGTGTDFADASPAVTGDYLFDPNGNETRTSGERVFVRPHSSVTVGEATVPTYMIVAGAGGGAADGFFAVLVKWNAGSDGNNTTYATWTYDLYALDDTGYTTPLNLSGALQPENSPARIAKWSVTKATDGTVGEAYYDAAGVIQLYTCREKIGGQNNCT